MKTKESKFRERLNWIFDPSSSSYCGYLVNIPSVIVQADTVEDLQIKAKDMAIWWLDYMKSGIESNEMEVVEITDLNEWLKNKK